VKAKIRRRRIPRDGFDGMISEKACELMTARRNQSMK